MSEISVLSTQYQKLVDVADRINKSVIVVKKREIQRSDHEGRYPKIVINDSELSASKNNVLNFLKYLLNLLNNEKHAEEALPTSTIEGYKRKLNETAHISEKISELIGSIEAENPLNDDNLKALDRVISILDTERALLFRKLRTARG